MRTRKTTPPSSSDRTEVRLQAPTSWGELSDRQLRYVLFLLSYDGGTLLQTDITVMLFFRLTGTSIVQTLADGVVVCRHGRRRFVITDEEVADLASRFNFVFSPKGYRPLVDIMGRKPVDAELHGLPFGHYLQLENFYQSYLAAPEQEPSPLDDMLLLLYPADSTQPETALPRDIHPAERMNVFLWYTSIKEVFATRFSHLFGPPQKDAAITQQRLIDAMDAQLRALTQGDITREQATLDADVWRALTELNALARDADELRRHNSINH